MTTKAKREGNARRLEKIEQIIFRLHKDGTDGITKSDIEATAQEDGARVNAWLVDTVKRKIQ